MTRRNLHRWVRLGHRYLGFILGIQFLLWTAGGLYFSWTNIDTIRGDDLKQMLPAFSLDSSNVSLSQIQKELRISMNVDSVESAQLVNVLGTIYYQIIYKSASGKRAVLADVRSGQLRPPLNEKEAIELARSRLKEPASVSQVKYITETDKHHEYRDKPLPAFAITFTGNVNTTVYVATELGIAQTFRNNQWRVFDFLWMLHTMDYAGRDNSNNWILRVFSLLGMLAILSGFVLFFISRKKSKVSNSNL